MKKLLLLTKMLLAAALLCVGQNAWGDVTIGNTSLNWLGSNCATSAYTLASDETLTFVFTVDESAGADYQGYVAVLENTSTMQDIGSETYAFIRSLCDYYSKGNWNLGALYNSNTYGSVSKVGHFVGATVTMEIRRVLSNLTVTTAITKNETTYYHYYVQDLETNDDIYAYLAADAAVLTIKSANITKSNPSSPIIQTISGTFTTATVGTLKPNGIMNLHFNGTNTIDYNTYETWGIELVYNNGTDIFFDMNSGYPEGAWAALKDNAKSATFEKSSNWPTTGTQLKSKWNEAETTVSILRTGYQVLITALITPTSGDPIWLKYTLVENEETYPTFASSNITVKLIARNSTVNIYYPISKLNAEVSKYGWATFSSNYKLDFTGVSGLEAYAVTGHEGNVITKSDALGVVAAGQGVLLKGTEGSSSTFYNIPVSTGDAYDGTNLMVAGTGASVSAEGGKTKYVLGVSAGDEAEFQKIVSTAATVAKGKAYLQFNEEILARSMRFSGDNITAVENVEAAAEAKAKEGKFIENGKLVIVKNGVKFNAAGAKLY